MNIRSLFQYKNDVNIAHWHMRKALTGGDDLPEMRTQKQLEAARLNNIRLWRAKVALRYARRIACGDFLYSKSTPTFLRRQAD